MIVMQEQFIRRIKEIFEGTVRDGALEKAAQAMKESVLGGGTVYVFDTGHFIRWELFSKTGSLACIRKLDFSLTVAGVGSAMIPLSPGEGFTRYILRSADVKKGDVIVIGSVSGAGMNVVDMALEARKLGLVTVALTSLAYTRAVAAIHPSGKRLFEVCDIVIDNGAPVGDAMVEYYDTGLKICPASGLSGVYIWWQMIALLTEKLMAEGFRPAAVSGQADQTLFPAAPVQRSIRDAFIRNIGTFLDERTELQGPALQSAAKILADAFENGARVHLHDTDGIIDSELYNRAGGPVSFRRLTYHLDLTNDVYGKEEKLRGEQTPLTALTDYVLRKSGAQAGDVLILAAPSTGHPDAAAMARSAAEYGLRVVGVFPGQGELSAWCDAALDTGAEPDALLDVENFGPMLPVSGLSGVWLLWNLVAVLAQELDSRGGKRIGFYKSVNFPGGWEYYEKLCARYEEDGNGFVRP